MSTADSDGPVSLAGAELSAVAFVRDYVEFHFDGPVLRSLTDPVVTTGGLPVRRTDERWRDALCGLIGATVLQVRVVEDVVIVVTFSADRHLAVPLTEDARVGPEAAHFMPAEWSTSGMWVY